MSTSREESLRYEKGKALVRALHLSEFAAAGAARGLALHQIDEQLERVARLLPDALQAGISMSEIARTTGISRPTLYELRARYGGTVGDLRLAVLQVIATSDGSTVDALVERLGRPASEIEAVVAEYEQKELLASEPVRVSEEDHEMQLFMTPHGIRMLEAWIFEADEERENG
jgi:transposase-like protein